MQDLIVILKILGGGLFGRIRGGFGNEMCRKILGKPDGWELPNNLICGLWGVYISLLFPLSIMTPVLALIVGATAKIGYLKQVAKYFGFPSGFNLALKENRTWKNYALLSARGALVCFPAYLCFYQLYPSLLGGVLAGLFMPIAYLIGFSLPETKVKIMPRNIYGLKIPEIKIEISHSQYGEWIIYSAIAGGILWTS